MMRIWATSMVLAAALVSGSTAKAADLAFEVVAVSSPSPSDTTAVLPGSLTDAIIGETYYLEVWVSDVGDINTGVTSAYVDLTWSGALAAGVSVGHGSIFNSLVTGSIGTGLVDELGGSTFSGSVGVEPTWARVATVTVQADSAGQVSYVLVASSTGCAAFGRGVIGWPDIDLGAGALVTQASLVDCNSNGVSDAQEIIAGTSGDCNNNGVPDECDITTGTSGDCNSSSIPDECERQTAFASQVIISTSANVARSVFAADLDGDGDADVLSASEVDDKIAWYENTDGLGTFGPQQIITTAANAAFSVFAADLDGDGDADVLTASVSDDTIAWYENIDGLGDFDSQHIITTAADGAISIYAVDLDGDGDFDVLSASDHVAWYENIDGLGNFGPQKAISAINYSLYSVIAADLDGDGDADALSVSVDDGKTAWYKNIDGLGTFGQENVIGTTPYAAFSIFAADLDGDGDTDVLSESSYEGKFVWYENTDGLGGFGPEKVITTSAYGVQAVAAADLDRDGDLDVLAGATVENEIAWYENTDGRGSFGPQQIITTDTNSPYGVITADLDGDGDLDVVSASDSDNKIAWYENIALNDCNQNGTLDECDIDGATSTDCNNNSMPDECEIMSGALGDCNSNGLPDECELDQNDCNSNAIPDECELDCNLNGVPDECDIANSSSSDCNNNGVPDVCEIASGSVDDCNANSIPDDCELQTVFLSQKTITNAANFAFSVFAADLDSDGDADILSASVYDDKIAWYENTDGLGGFGSQQVITTAADGASSVFAEDLDGDGDLDVLSASRNVAKIAWYENTDGLGGFGPQQTISIAADGAHSVFAVDLDGDRDPDVLSASIFDNKIAWYENTDGQGVFGPQQVITTAAIGAISVFAVDLDGDGDTDVISASSDDDKIAWYENSDGLGTFGPQHVITTAADVARSVFAAD
ncbi:MAG TPA: VCBS repeat-containing protein, partial [Phycisphaerae bacterium]|nr:VCBS repeat-containing protein [Phycisphaerae bacterium]